MDLLIAFLIFLAGMVGSIVFDFSMIIPLVVGLLAFGYVGTRRNFSVKEVSQMAITGARESFLVIQIMCIIGFLTATWRISGTITLFVYYGIKLITPSMFLLIAYLLSTVLSYAIGTSFGVAGTVGIIFMALARSGNVNPVITAGVIMSGVYFGDRGSPVSSAANMVAGITGTEIYDNTRNAMKSAIVPFLLTLAVYTFLSVSNPITHVDQELVRTFEEAFKLSVWAIVPAVLMLGLPLLKVKVRSAMFASIASGVLVALFVQNTPVKVIIKSLIFGYTAEGEGLGNILNGGGLTSMLEIAVILAISSAYSGIFNGTEMLSTLEEKIGAACSRFGRLVVMTVSGILMCMVFCNQTVAVLMVKNLLAGPYEKEGASKSELALDLTNSVLIIAGIVPWCIACSIPLSFFGVGYEAMAYGCYLYLVPICHLLLKKKLYKNI